MQIKTILIYHYVPTRIAKITNLFKFLKQEKYWHKFEVWNSHALLVKRKAVEHTGNSLTVSFLYYLYLS